MAMGSSSELFLAGEEDDFGFEFVPIDLSISHWELVDPSDDDSSLSDVHRPDLHRPQAAAGSFYGGDDGDDADTPSGVHPGVISAEELLCEQPGWIVGRGDDTVVPFPIPLAGSEPDRIMVATREYLLEQFLVRGGQGGVPAFDLYEEEEETYEDEEEEEEEDDDGLDDELVPRYLRGKLGRQRMVKLGKRACSKMNTSKRSPHLYVKPGCVNGKHGLGLKNSLC